MDQQFYGLIFMDQFHTTKSTKFNAPQIFLHILYLNLDKSTLCWSACMLKIILSNRLLHWTYETVAPKIIFQVIHLYFLFLYQLECVSNLCNV